MKFTKICLFLIHLLFLTFGIAQSINIEKFLPVRTVIKPNRDIPFFALIKNNQNQAVNISYELILPQNVNLANGNATQNINLQAQQTDSIYWHLNFHSIGSQDIILKINFNSQTIQDTLNVDVKDVFWEQHNFLLSAYCPPYAWRGPPYLDSDFQYFSDANFDTFLWVRDDDDLMQKVHQFNFKYLLNINSIIDEDILRGDPHNNPPDVTEQQLQELDSLIDVYKNDPKLIGYYLCDEPYENGFENIGKVIQRIRERDPERFSFVNLWPYFPNEIGDDRYLENFIQIAKPEFLSFDKYTFYNGWDETDEFITELERVRKQAKRYNIPFGSIIQAVGTNGTSVAWNGNGPEQLDWRTPNESEHRWLVYTSLVYGVHGINWFPWDVSDWGVVQNPARDTIYPSIQNINTEIDSLKEIMLHLKTNNVYHWDNGQISKVTDSIDIRITSTDNSHFIIGNFKDSLNNPNYFMVVNKDYSNDFSGELHINYLLQNLQVFNIQSGQWENINYNSNNDDTSFQIYLRGGEGKLFKFEGANANAVSELHELTKLNLISYPNPFKQNIYLEYIIPDKPNKIKRRVKIFIYDMKGKKILTLLDKKQMPGKHTTKLKTQNLSKDTYLVVLEIDGKVMVRKILKN